MSDNPTLSRTPISFKVEVLDIAGRWGAAILDDHDRVILMCGLTSKDEAEHDRDVVLRAMREVSSPPVRAEETLPNTQVQP